MPIIESSQDSDDSSLKNQTNAREHQKTYISIPSSTHTGALSGGFILFALAVLIPFSVHAGVFSSLVDILSSEEVLAQDLHRDNSAQDLDLLSATNNPDPKGALGGGDVIIDNGVLIAGGTLGEDEMSEAKTYTGEISVYVVREGDSLSRIAEMYDVTSNTILWANDLDSPTDIHPGQSLVILPIAGVRHLVKDGDTMSTIAKKYDADIDEILEYNQLSLSDALTVGETLIIPGGEVPTPVRSSITSSQYAGSGSASSGGGSWLSNPVPGSIKTQGTHGYNGVDLASSYGTAIHAAAAGEVIVSKSSGWNGGYGNYIVVKHANGVQTLYAHLSSNAVSVGSYVDAGEVIGAMGSTGRSTGVHLHFEVRGARNPF